MNENALTPTQKEWVESIFAYMENEIIIIDRNGIIEYINPSAENFLNSNLKSTEGALFDNIFLITDKDREKLTIHSIISKLKENKKICFEEITIFDMKQQLNHCVQMNFWSILDVKKKESSFAIMLHKIKSEVQINNETKEYLNNLKVTFEHSHMSMAAVDEQATIKLANRSFLELFQFSPADLEGQSIGKGLRCINSFKHSCGNSPICTECIIRRELQKVIKTGIACKELLIKHIHAIDKEKAKPWYKLSIIPIQLNKKREAVIVLEDISQQKQLEEMLKESNEYLLSILDHFPALVRKDNIDGECEYVNKTWCEFTGNTYEKALFKKWQTMIYPEDKDHYIKFYKESVDKREIYVIEYRMKHYDGDYRWVTEKGMPLFDADGSFNGYIGMSLDIHDRKMAEQAMRESEEKFRKLFINLTSGFAYHRVIFDEQGNIVDLEFILVNHVYEKMFQVEQEELIGKRYSEVFPKDKKSFIQNAKTYGEIVRDKKSIYLDEAYLEAFEKWYSIAMYSPEEQNIAIVISDIDEKKRSQMAFEKAKEEAEAANKAKSEFFANMSHEIRTPINGIVGMIDLTLLAELKAEHRDNLNIAKNCANALLKIVNDILDFSKMEAGKLLIDYTTFDIKALVQELFKVHTPRADEKGLEFTYSFSSGIPRYLIGDVSRVQQILNNLISNAIKFTSNGEVNIAIRKGNRSEDFVEIKFLVTDTGIGISKEEMNSLFKTFSQVDGSITKKFGGTGLGLIISKQLVEMMGGVIGVESEKGKGSTFYFTIPFKVGEQKSENHYQQPLIKSSQSINILLAEDDKINQIVISRMLKEKGYEVDIAHNGIEALKYYNQKKYDTILMDIQMPEMDGIETTKRIRAREVGIKNTPIIALTAYALHGDKERLLALGMDEYLAKPMAMNELLAMIERVVSKHDQDVSLSDIHIDNEGNIVIKKESLQLDENVLQTLIIEIEEHIKNLIRNLNYGNLTLIEIIAHDIKTLCDKLGENELKDVAFQIELAVRRNNIEAAIEYSIMFEQKFKVFKNIFV